MQRKKKTTTDERRRDVKKIKNPKNKFITTILFENGKA